MIEFKSVFDPAEQRWAVVATNGEREATVILPFSKYEMFVAGLEDLVDDNFIPLVFMETVVKSLVDLLNNLSYARLLDDRHYRYAVLAYYDFICKYENFDVIEALKGEKVDGNWND